MPLIATTLTIVTFSDIAPRLSGYTGAALGALGGGYVLACTAFPFRPCRACKGMGRHLNRGVFGGIRLCTACKATGLKLRAGRKAWNYLRRTRRNSR
ncbi:hypothetical protein M8C13_40410 [Crossiella sp. SN42]|uniref:hypothetical protein n=1 Tax=Crossiella sp. SN42 TaxID=2944808 RepID=UPI00207CEA5E|nr:hypothetical protein [Crossiella sp. SN42]MCO1582031.1 hypothetical protein [Crossiella sp. SN42]